MAINPFYPHAPGYENYHLPAFTSLIAKGVEKKMEEILNFDSDETDVILTTFPKAGTNWVYDILHMLTTGKTEYFQMKEGSSLLEAADLDRIRSNKKPWRLLFCHLPFRHLPKKHIKNGYKVVYIIRNPKDVAVSFYNHLKMDKNTVTENFPGSWDNYIENVIRKRIDLYGNWFDHTREWEQAKAKGKCKNVHTTTFEDLKKDPVAEIKRMSIYLGYQHSDEFLEQVALQCSFEKVVEATKTSVKDISLIKNVSIDGSDFIRRKGEVGNWKKWFTVDQNERFDELIEREMKGSKIKLTYEL